MYKLMNIDEEEEEGKNRMSMKSSQTYSPPSVPPSTPPETVKTPSPGKMDDTENESPPSSNKKRERGEQSDSGGKKKKRRRRRERTRCLLLPNPETAMYTCVCGFESPLKDSAMRHTTSTSGTHELKTVDGYKLIGLRLQVYWGYYKKWYAGEIISFDEEEGKHNVQYDDGDNEDVYLPDEMFQLFPPSDERDDEIAVEDTDWMEIYETEKTNQTLRNIAIEYQLSLHKLICLNRRKFPHIKADTLLKKGSSILIRCMDPNAKKDKVIEEESESNAKKKKKSKDEEEDSDDEDDDTPLTILAKRHKKKKKKSSPKSPMLKISADESKEEDFFTGDIGTPRRTTPLRDLSMEELKTEELRLKRSLQDVQLEIDRRELVTPADNSSMCVVCKDQRRSAVLLPCRHLCVCRDCADNNLERCPTCLGEVGAVVSVILS